MRKWRWRGPLRLKRAGALCHVTSRGDWREPIVEADEDRAAWATELGEVCELFGWRVHAWCLMTNHYHLLVETPGNLSTGMRRLTGDVVWVGAGLPSEWEGPLCRVFLGSDAFVEAMTQELDMDDPKLRDVSRVQRRPPPKALVPLIESVPACEADADAFAPRVPSRARDAAMAAAYATGQHPLRAIADAFGVHEATVSRVLRRAKWYGSSKERGL